MAEIQARHKTVGTIQRSILIESFVTFPTAPQLSAVLRSDIAVGMTSG